MAGLSLVRSCHDPAFTCKGGLLRIQSGIDILAHEVGTHRAICNMGNASGYVPLLPVQVAVYLNLIARNTVALGLGSNMKREQQKKQNPRKKGRVSHHE